MLEEGSQDLAQKLISPLACIIIYQQGLLEPNHVTLYDKVRALQNCPCADVRYKVPFGRAGSSIAISNIDAFAVALSSIPFSSSIVMKPSVRGVLDRFRRKSLPASVRLARRGERHSEPSLGGENDLLRSQSIPEVPSR